MKLKRIATRIMIAAIYRLCCVRESTAITAKVATGISSLNSPRLCRRSNQSVKTCPVIMLVYKGRIETDSNNNTSICTGYDVGIDILVEAFGLHSYFGIVFYRYRGFLTSILNVVSLIADVLH